MNVRLFLPSLLLAASALPAWGQIPPFSPASLVALSSSQCVDVSGASKQAGAAVLQVTCCLGKTASQVWTLSNPTGEGTIANKNSGLCLAATAGTDGSRVVQAACSAGNAAQIWTLRRSPNLGTQLYQLFNKLSGRCLELPGASKETGVQLVVRTCLSPETHHQLFQLNHPF